MTLKSDPELEEKLICCFTNDNNLSNINLRTREVKCLRFD